MILIVVLLNQLPCEFLIPEVQARSEQFLDLFAWQTGLDLELCLTLDTFGQIILLFVPAEVDVQFVLLALLEVFCE